MLLCHLVSTISWKFASLGGGQRSRYSDSLRAVRSGDRIPVGGEIFRIRPDRPWCPLSLLCNGYRVSFPGVKRPGRGADYPSPTSAEVKEIVELFLYSPSGPSWYVLGWTYLTCTFTFASLGLFAAMSSVLIISSPEYDVTTLASVNPVARRHNAVDRNYPKSLVVPISFFRWIKTAGAWSIPLTLLSLPYSGTLLPPLFRCRPVASLEENPAHCPGGVESECFRRSIGDLSFFQLLTTMFRMLVPFFRWISRYRKESYCVGPLVRISLEL